ncbi:MAG TPA: transglycosylase domain-containing protein [Vicinamibacterales bacterium]|nr:transglycosylase domain-containing protein [Vicinamibacterales bacterium]
MGLIERRTLAYLLIAGALCAAVFFPALYFLGLALAPPLPAPAPAPVPRLVGEAIWARANGGRATEVIPITPFSMARLATCVAIEDYKDTSEGDAHRIAACQEHLPALFGMEYLSRMHMREANLQPSFREGLGRLSTTIWLTHAFSKAEFLNTIAERGEVGPAFRGVEAAAHGYFGRPAARLSLAQAALVGGLVGDRRTDPWCQPDAARAIRDRILERMQSNGAISEAEREAASASPLELAEPPDGRPSCRP